MKVILIGNYAHDAQESMQRFRAMMEEGLRASGNQVKTWCPRPWLGKLRKSGHGMGKWLGYIDKFLVFPVSLRFQLWQWRRRNPQAANSLVVHICDHSNAFYTRFLRDEAHVVTCHDLLAVRSALGEIAHNRTRWTGRQLQKMVVGGLRRAQHIVCISEATRRDVERIISPARDRLSTIPVALNYPYARMDEEAARSRLTKLLPQTVAGRFLLHVGGNQWYKNRLGALRIYKQAIEQDPSLPPFVLAGKELTSDMREFIETNALQERVWSIEGCDNEDLRALYSCAELLVFPSLAEGFGWPVIEAQACGCPVLCSSVDPLPEVAQASARTHAPTDETGFAAELMRLLGQPEELQALARAGLANASRFQPEAMIEKYIACYRRVIECRTAPSP